MPNRPNKPNKFEGIRGSNMGTAVEAPQENIDDVIFDELKELALNEFRVSHSRPDIQYIIDTFWLQRRGVIVNSDPFQGNDSIRVISVKGRAIIIPAPETFISVTQSFDLFEKPHEWVDMEKGGFVFQRDQLVSFPEARKRLNEETGEEEWVITKKGVLKPGHEYKGYARKEPPEWVKDKPGTFTREQKVLREDKSVVENSFEVEETKQKLKNFLFDMVNVMSDDKVSQLLDRVDYLEKVLLGEDNAGPKESVENDNVEPDQKDLEDKDMLKLIIGGIIRIMDANRASGLLKNKKKLEKQILLTSHMR